METNPTPTAINPVNGLADARTQFAIWLATPSDQRTPSTQAALATVLGVARETLSRWRRDGAVEGEHLRELRRLVRYGLAAGLDAQIKRAAAGDLAALQFCLRFVGMDDASERKDGETTPQPIAGAQALAINVNVSNDEVDQAVARRVGLTKLLDQFELKDTAPEPSAENLEENGPTQ